MRMARSSRWIAVLLAAVLAAASLPSLVRAQTARAAGGMLAARTKAFGEAIVQGFHKKEIAEYFPRRGAWTWVHTAHHPDGDRVGVWRFDASEMLQAQAACGPLFETFNLQIHRQPVGRLVQQVGEAAGEWRRAGRRRFEVPPSWSGRAAFVEWRREDGRWVISSVGDESFHEPRPRGRAVGMVMRDTAPVMSREDAYSTEMSWFENTEPITFEGHRYVKYGQPRTIERRELAWIGRLGVVRAYVERGVPEGYEEILYLPTGPGEYQPYQTYTRARRCPRAPS
jgi:hypothetical protein